MAKALFCAGCFWGVQFLFDTLKGVKSTTVGYAGGSLENPTYEQVCSGTTGHAECVLVQYEAQILSYEDLVKFFFEIHDFTQVDRQGPDIGSQYRSVIFYFDQEQKQIAEEIRLDLLKMGYDVATEIEEFRNFWPAEQYHQKYYQKTGKRPYCHIHRKVFDTDTPPKFGNFNSLNYF